MLNLILKGFLIPKTCLGLIVLRSMHSMYILFPPCWSISSFNPNLHFSQRLYKLVKWCKSLPLFKNILIDDQIALLINAWCELLVLSCCYRSMSHPGVIRVSNDVTLSINTARQHGIEKCVEKMLNFAEQLRRLKVDHYEYVSMKVIVLLTSGKYLLSSRPTGFARVALQTLL